MSGRKLKVFLKLLELGALLLPRLFAKSLCLILMSSWTLLSHNTLSRLPPVHLLLLLRDGTGLLVIFLVAPVVPVTGSVAVSASLLSVSVSSVSPVVIVISSSSLVSLSPVVIVESSSVVIVTPVVISVSSVIIVTRGRSSGSSAPSSPSGTSPHPLISPARGHVCLFSSGTVVMAGTRLVSDHGAESLLLVPILELHRCDAVSVPLDLRRNLGRLPLPLPVLG